MKAQSGCLIVVFVMCPVLVRHVPPFVVVVVVRVDEVVRRKLYKLYNLLGPNRIGFHVRNAIEDNGQSGTEYKQHSKHKKYSVYLYVCSKWK